MDRHTQVLASCTLVCGAFLRMGCVDVALWALGLECITGSI